MKSLTTIFTFCLCLMMFSNCGNNVSSVAMYEYTGYISAGIHGKSVPNATIEVYKYWESTPTMIAETSASSTGKFSVILEDERKDLTIKVSAPGFDDYTAPLNSIQDRIIVLEGPARVSNRPSNLREKSSGTYINTPIIRSNDIPTNNDVIWGKPSSNVNHAESAVIESNIGQ